MVLITALCSLMIATYAQKATSNEKLEAEVNEQVWKPFKKAFEARDGKQFNALHTDDVMRISTWSGIKVGKEYKDAIEQSYQKEDGRKRTIDFWLEHRFYRENAGYEVGYYRIITEEEGKAPRAHYARFHIVLKKVNGSWKIAQDWDVSNINGQEVTEEDFAKGTPLDL